MNLLVAGSLLTFTKSKRSRALKEGFDYQVKDVPIADSTRAIEVNQQYLV